MSRTLEPLLLDVLIVGVLKTCSSLMSALASAACLALLVIENYLCIGISMYMHQLIGIPSPNGKFGVYRAYRKLKNEAYHS